MTRKMLALLSLVGVAVVGVSLAVAQFDEFEDYGRRGRRWRGGDEGEYDNASMGPPKNRNGVPTWEVDPKFKHDVFTFVRVAYGSWRESWRRPKWKTDYPDSDLNFSYRLAELTSLKVDPNGKILRLTDPELFDFPFLYLIEPGEMSLEEEEVVALRRYLLNGGFLMVDDFWGEREWETLAGEMKRVFPDREPQELPLEHEIFHCVYDLKVKPQIPSISHFLSGETTERWDAPEANYRAIFDDKQRIMVIICHNTDLGDGWEREGAHQEYFREYSEKYAYPLGINIVTYAMTH